jgi:hypothetical protein
VKRVEWDGKGENVLWNCMLVAKGASSADRNERLGGIWSHGKGPEAAKLVKFRAVITVWPSYKLPAHIRMYSETLTIENNNLVGRVNIQGIAKGEGDGVVESRVRRRVVFRDRRVGQARNELLNPADTLHSTHG